uniref:Uncharacterized protein n=1 Tax=Lactuca sativa TaxID=4236 RepID=A0A9R1VTU9_LACSA|nr:hypothetical protein LSAT_V11C400187800 [Lactuca sativa]
MRNVMAILLRKNQRFALALNLQILMGKQTSADRKTTMCVQEWRATIKDFYDVIFLSILQLQSGITDLEERKQKEIYSKRYSRKDEKKNVLRVLPLPTKC